MKCKTKGIQYLVTVLAVVLAVSFGATVAAAPPPTQFMPGFPILAGDTIMVMWLPVPGAVKYVLYMNDKKVAEGAAPPIQIPTPAEGGSYNLQIAAVDAAGAEGPKSSTSTIKILKLEPPKDLEGRYMAGNIALRWKGSAAAVIYNVLRSEEKGKNYQLVVSTQMTQFVDSNPPKDKNFFYVVTAKDISGKESSYSPEIAVSTKVEEVKETGQVVNTLKMLPSKALTEILLFGSQAFMSPVDIVGIDGRLFVASGANGKITVVDEKSGEWIKAFAGRFPTQVEAQVGIAFGIGADRRGRIFLCAGSKVVVFDQEGNVLKVITQVPPEEKEIVDAAVKGNRGRMPDVSYYDMAEAADGSILIVDNGFARVAVFDPDTFQMKRSIGKYGTTKPMEFNHPTFIGSKKDGEVWIDDTMNRRAQVLKADYTLKYVTGEAKTFVGSFLGMGGVTTSPEGDWMVSDPPMATVQVFGAANGKYLHHVADENLKVDENGQRPFWRVVNPAGIWVNAAKGILYMCSPQTDEVLVRQILKAKGGE